MITKDNRLVALDGKMMIDDNALFRHPDLAEMRDMDEEAPAETEARRHGLSFIKLDGNIGCMVNGAGLAMTSMDIIKLFGGEPANFLDIGGGAGAEKVAAAMRIILSDPNVKAVLFNIFGGITRCDEVARGILAAMEEVKPKVPMVVRLVGTNAEEGRKLLENANMITAETLADAAQRKAVAASKGITRLRMSILHQQKHTPSRAGHYRQRRPLPHHADVRLRHQRRRRRDPRQRRRMGSGWKSPRLRFGQTGGGCNRRKLLASSSSPPASPPMPCSKPPTPASR